DGFRGFPAVAHADRTAHAVDGGSCVGGADAPRGPWPAPCPVHTGPAHRSDRGEGWTDGSGRGQGLRSDCRGHGAAGGDARTALTASCTRLPYLRRRGGIETFALTSGRSLPHCDC